MHLLHWELCVCEGEERREVDSLSKSHKTMSYFIPKIQNKKWCYIILY